MATRVNPNKFNVAPVSSPEAVSVCASADGSIEDAVRSYNQGREKIIPAKGLIIEPFLEEVPAEEPPK